MPSGRDLSALAVFAALGGIVVGIVGWEAVKWLIAHVDLRWVE